MCANALAVRSAVARWRQEHVRRGGSLTARIDRRVLASSGVRTVETRRLERKARLARKRGGAASPYVLFQNARMKAWSAAHGTQATLGQPSRRLRCKTSPPGGSLATAVLSGRRSLRKQRQTVSRQHRAKSLEEMRRLRVEWFSDAGLRQHWAARWRWERSEMSARATAVPPPCQRQFSSKDSLWGCGDKDGFLTMRHLHQAILALRPECLHQGGAGPISLGRQLLAERAKKLLVLNPGSGAELVPAARTHRTCWEMHPGFCRTRHAQWQRIVMTACGNLNNLCRRAGKEAAVGLLCSLSAFSGDKLLVERFFIVASVRLARPPVQVFCHCSHARDQDSARERVTITLRYAGDELLMSTSYASIVSLCQDLAAAQPGGPSKLSVQLWHPEAAAQGLRQWGARCATPDEAASRHWPSEVELFPSILPPVPRKRKVKEGGKQVADALQAALASLEKPEDIVKKVARQVAKALGLESTRTRRSAAAKARSAKTAPSKRSHTGARVAQRSSGRPGESNEEGDDAGAGVEEPRPDREEESSSEESEEAWERQLHTSHPSQQQPASSSSASRQPNHREEHPASSSGAGAVGSSTAGVGAGSCSGAVAGSSSGARAGSSVAGAGSSSGAAGSSNDGAHRAEMVPVESGGRRQLAHDERDLYSNVVGIVDIGVAKTNRSKCAQCQEIIEKDAVRFMVCLQNRKPSRWMHTRCVRFLPEELKGSSRQYLSQKEVQDLPQDLRTAIEEAKTALR